MRKGVFQPVDISTKLVNKKVHRDGSKACDMQLTRVVQFHEIHGVIFKRERVATRQKKMRQYLIAVGVHVGLAEGMRATISLTHGQAIEAPDVTVKFTLVKSSGRPEEPGF